MGNILAGILFPMDCHGPALTKAIASDRDSVLGRSRRKLIPIMMLAVPSVRLLAVPGHRGSHCLLSHGRRPLSGRHGHRGSRNRGRRDSPADGELPGRAAACSE